MTKKSNRGGLRNPPGGRPPKEGVAMVSTSIRLPPDLIKWLRENARYRRNEFILEAIREKIAKIELNQPPARPAK
jgi:hypothetical protein